MNGIAISFSPTAKACGPRQVGLCCNGPCTAASCAGLPIMCASRVVNTPPGTDPNPKSNLKPKSDLKKPES